MKNIKHLIDEATKKSEKIHDLDQLNQFRIYYLGKKGVVNELMKQLSSASVEEKATLGAEINTVKKEINALIVSCKENLENEMLNAKLKNEIIDVTLPGRGQKVGTQHLITQTIKKITDYFTRLGFSCIDGPEIEDEFHNFEALNIPEHHPARAMHDTFYTKSHHVLRTHTSPVQVRIMKKEKPPLAVICPGKVYRCDSDQTHSPMFHQIEILYVAENVHFTHLKTLLTSFLKDFFEKKDLKLRFRPSYFPFTEPSAEVDIAWGEKEGETKWLEVLGCGMVHPNVFKHTGIDDQRYSGFALGLGVERFAMLHYKVDDLRQFFHNDLSFLRQFIS